MQSSATPCPLPDDALPRTDALISLAMLPPLAPVPPPPFHPARNSRLHSPREQAAVLAPSMQAQPLPASEQLRLVRDAGRAFAAATEPVEVLRALLRSLKPLSRFIACAALLRDEMGRYEVAVVARQAMSARALEHMIERLGREAHRFGLPPIEAAHLAGCRVFDVPEDADSTLASAPAAEAPALFVQPLLGQGQAGGVLGVAVESAERVPGAHEELLTMLLEGAAARLDHLSLQQTNRALLEEVRGERQRFEQWKDMFLSSVSHELRTPLTPIKGYTQLLLRRAARRLVEAANKETADHKQAGAAIKDEQHALENIQSAAEHLERLVNTLLDVALLQRGQLQAHLRVVNLAELLEQAIRSVRLSAEQREVVLRLEAAETLVLADRERLRAMLGNLLEYRLHAASRGGVMQVRALEQGEECLVVISEQDEGLPPHLPKQYVARLPHVLLQDAQQEEGVGVSLAHAQAILHLHGGRLWAEARPHGEGGINLLLALPRHEAAEKQGGAGST